jgi:hypothetical protein
MELTKLVTGAVGQIIRVGDKRVVNAKPWGQPIILPVKTDDEIKIHERVCGFIDENTFKSKPNSYVLGRVIEAKKSSEMFVPVQYYVYNFPN